MQYPLSTGDAARLIGGTEPQLAELVRRGLVRPEPVIRAGRRLWQVRHTLQAAEHLGVLTDELRERIEHGSLASNDGSPS